MNFYLKNGPAISDLLLSNFVRRSKPIKIRNWGTGIHPSMYLPLGDTITESSPDKNTPITRKGVEDETQAKRGNPGKMDAGPFSSFKALITYYIPKLRPGFSSRVGGKISEEAKAESNSSDTRTEPRTGLIREGALVTRGRALKISGSLNSVRLNEAPLILNGGGNSVQDLLGARRESTLTRAQLLPTVEERVGVKQRELVQLAKLKGVYDKKVLDMQLILARSRLFRVHAVELMRRKSGSQTPGVDKEIYDKEDEHMFEELVGYLRMVTYHPNQYRAEPVKRV